MLFVTYQGIEFHEKSCKKDDFKTDWDDVIWCIRIEEDINSTIVNMMCAKASQPLIMFVFESEIYKKVDKLSWEVYLYNTDERTYKDFVNNELENELCEYVVPFSEFSKGLKCWASLYPLYMKEEDDAWGNEIFCSPYFDRKNNKELNGFLRNCENDLIKEFYKHRDKLIKMISSKKNNRKLLYER